MSLILGLWTLCPVHYRSPIVAPTACWLVQSMLKRVTTELDHAEIIEWPRRTREIFKKLLISTPGQWNCKPHYLSQGQESIAHWNPQTTRGWDMWSPLPAEFRITLAMRYPNHDDDDHSNPALFIKSLLCARHGAIVVLQASSLLILTIAPGGGPP